MCGYCTYRFDFVCIIHVDIYIYIYIVCIVCANLYTSSDGIVAQVDLFQELRRTLDRCRQCRDRGLAGVASETEHRIAVRT